MSFLKNETRGSLGDKFGNLDEGYESLVDLFTLLSITLIVASLVFGIYKEKLSQGENDRNEIELSTVSAGGKNSYQQSVPDDQIILLVNVKKDGKLYLTILKNNTLDKNIPLVSNKKSLFFILDKEVRSYLTTHKFILVLGVSGNSTPYSDFTMIQEWFNNNGKKQLSTQFWSQ